MKPLQLLADCSVGGDITKRAAPRERYRSRKVNFFPQVGQSAVSRKNRPQGSQQGPRDGGILTTRWGPGSGGRFWGDGRSGFGNQEESPVASIQGAETLLASVNTNQSTQLAVCTLAVVRSRSCPLCALSSSSVKWNNPTFL